MKIRNIVLLCICLLSVNLSFAQSSFLAEDGVAVFYPAEFDSAQTLPSLIIEKELNSSKKVPSNWQIVPEFSQSEGNSIVEIFIRWQSGFIRYR